MKRVGLLTAALALLWGGIIHARPLAIVHATAVTMTASRPVANATIVVDGGRIASVQANGVAPAGAEIIDARGRTVTPGLVNGSTQLGLVEVSSATETRDTVATGGALGASFDVSYALNGNSALVALARADGLTRALSYPGASEVPPFAGLAALIRLRPGVDILDRPRAAMFVVIGGGSWERSAGSRAAQWQLLREALKEARTVRPLVATGRRLLLNPRDAAALRPVLAGAIPLAIVTHRESDIRQAISLANDFHIRVVIVGGAEAWRAADALALAHIPVILDPQLNLPGNFDQLGARQDNAAILARAKVRIAFGLAGGALGFNYNAGLALREGAGLAVANGLPYDEALRALTVNPLSIWGGAGGTLAPGSDADLVIWDGDPLEPGTLADVVIIEGRQVSTENRQTDLMRRYGGAKSKPR
jgi:imidazolonepropionase-like amidohydrolase